jgi:hypothetical protein
MALTNLLGGLSLDATTAAITTQLQTTLKTSDTSDVEYIVSTALVTASGDNIIYTPAAGKSIRLRWVYALNSPTSTSPALITIKLGTVVKYITYGVSKKQIDTGPINGSLVINLSQAGTVACTFRLEEV